MGKMSKKFLIRTLLLAILLVIFYIISEYLLKLSILPDIFPYLIVVFLLVYNFSFHLLSRVALQNFRRFLNLNMILTFAKLLLMMAVVLAYLFFIRVDILQFIISFFVLYLLFTSLEVASIVPEVRKNQQSS